MTDDALTAAADLAYVQALKQERDLARADNGALAGLVSYLSESIDWDNQVFSLAAQRIHNRIQDMLTTPHPGLSLLSELEAARELIAQLRTEYEPECVCDVCRAIAEYDRKVRRL